MKRIVLVAVAMMVTLCFASAVMAAEQTTTKVKETPSGEVTKTKMTSETPESYTKFKTVQVNNGKFTTEKGKALKITNPNLDTSHGVRVEVVKFKSISEDNPDNTYVTVVKDQQEVVRNLDEKARLANVLKNSKTEKMTIYSSYNPDTMTWDVFHAEVNPEIK